MARLYAATGDAIARLEERGSDWDVEVSLRGSGAQCLAVNPKESDTVFAGLRTGGVQKTTDGGRTWNDCALPQPGVFSLAVGSQDGAVYAGTEPSALFRSDDGGRGRRGAEGGGGGGAGCGGAAGEAGGRGGGGGDRHYTWSVAVDPDDPELWYVSASTGPFAAHGHGDPQARIYARRDGEWRALAGGLPQPIPAMPYALVAVQRRAFPGLAGGTTWGKT